MEAIFDQLSQTKPVTLGGAIAMLQHECVEELIAPVVEGLRDLRQQEASRSSFAPDMNQRDSTLLAAERRLAELKLTEDETYRSYSEAGRPITFENEEELICDVFDEEVLAALRIIDETPQQSLVGAAVKLRRLATKEDDGLEQPLSYASVRQVLAIVEREIASRSVTLAGHQEDRELLEALEWLGFGRDFGDEAGNDAEPDVIGFGEPDPAA